MSKIKKSKLVKPGSNETLDKTFPASKKSLRKKVATAVVLSAIEKRAAPYLRKLNQVTKVTKENFDEVGIQLKALKTIADEADQLEKETTAGLKESLARIKELFKPFKNSVAQRELTLKLLMSNYLEQSKNKVKQLEQKFETGGMRISAYAKKMEEIVPTSTSGGAKIRKVWTAVIVDEKKIPREYLVPDLAAITKAFRDDPTKNITGVEWKQIEQIAI